MVMMTFQSFIESCLWRGASAPAKAAMTCHTLAALGISKEVDFPDSEMSELIIMAQLLADRRTPFDREMRSPRTNVIMLRRDRGGSSRCCRGGPSCAPWQ